MPENGIFQNPIIAEQAKAEVPFVRDAFLGHTLPKGKEFIGEKEYISLEAMIEEVKQSGKRVILNIGDSSTSGWDSNIVFENRQRYERGEPLRPGFFNYETYSDFLRERLRDRFLVINAGVPAHTSLQGIRRLEQLVEIFKEEGIKLDYVTAYYGNNDCVWERNREDKDWISPSFFRNLRNRFRRTEYRVITRTNPKDYKKNMEGIVKYCRQQGIVPILI